MTDLVLIHPGAQHGIYGELGDTLTAVEPPLWCRLIAGYVRDKGFSVRILDAEVERWSPAETAARALASADGPPKLVCICVFGHQPSASSQQMTGAGETARYLARINETHNLTVPVIMVGGHVSALPERTLREEAISYACKGEGPVTIVGLLEGRPNEDIPGLVWYGELDLKAGPTVTVNPSAPLLNVDELHGDAWDLLPSPARYRAHQWQCFGDLGARQPYASIYTSLGCPYRCSFCCINAPFDSNRYRMRSPAKVVQEMLDLWDRYGVKTFKIVDEMFVLNERHYTEIAQRLIDLDLEVEFNIWAYSRIDTVKEGHLDLLRRAGFRWLALGIESGSAHVRDGASKALRNDDIIGVVRAIQKADINVIGNFIFGLRDDDLQSMQQTLDLALTLNCEFSNFYSAMAYPGSPLYTQALKEGWTLPATWRGFSQHNDDCRPLDTERTKAKIVLEFRDAAFNLYFTHPRYLDMVEKKFGAETLAHVKDMTKFKLKRKLLTGEIT